MRVGFFGTPEVSATYLEALASRHEVVRVVTQPDRPRGRSKKLVPCRVKALALELGLEVVQPQTGECPNVCQRFRELKADICVVIAFGQKLPCGVNGCGDGECVNVHYSLLPILRGAAPVQHAILQGLEQTGVTVQFIAPEWDAGDVILQRSLFVNSQDTTVTLTERLTELGVPALLDALDLLETGRATRTPQDETGITWAPAIKKEDGRIDWDEDADTIVRKVRAFNPWPVAFTHLAGKPLRVLAAHAEPSAGCGGGESGTVVEIRKDKGFAVSCGTGRLWLDDVQPAGKKPMKAADYLRGSRLAIGTQLG